MGLFDFAGGIFESMPGIGGIFGAASSADQAKRIGRIADEEARRMLEAEQELYGKMVNPRTTVGPSSVAKNAYADPAFVQRQLDALGILGGMSAGQPSLSMQDQARLSAIQNQQRMVDQGQRQAIMQQAAMSGMLQGGNTLGAELRAQQNAANQAANQDLGVFGDAQDRQLQALNMLGDMSATGRRESFGESLARSQAEDAIAQFNAAQMGDEFARQMALNNARMAARQAAGNYRTGAAHNMFQAQQQAHQNAAASRKEQTEMMGNIMKSFLPI